jgi:SAM-dependent methyltransferase
MVMRGNLINPSSNMPRINNILFTARHLTPERVGGKRIIDVGACDFNGSIRPLLDSYGPAEYMGIDLLSGPGVDRVMNADDMVEVFGQDSFDIVIAMEMMEHTPDWRRSLSAIKGVCKPGGYMAVTSPALGHAYHGFPDDYWRYEEADWQVLFSDCEILEIHRDPTGPGTEVFVRKPPDFREADLTGYALHSMVAGCRIAELLPEHWKGPHFRKVRMQQWMANNSRRWFLGAGQWLRRRLGL